MTIEHFLNIPSASGPSYSADGECLAYLSDSSGVPQLWQLDVGSNSATQLTHHDDKVAFAKYAPNGRDLIYGMDSGGDERQQLYLLAESANTATPLTASPQAMYRWGGWHPQSRQIAYAANKRNPQYFDAYIFDLDTMTQRCVFEGTDLYSVVCWSPDGGFLLVQLALASSTIELFLVAAEGGPLQRLTPENSANRYGNFCWKKEASGFYLCSNENREFLGIGFYDLAQRNIAWLHTPNWDIETIQLSPDESHLAYVMNEDGYAKLAIIDLASGQHISVPTHPPGIIPEIAWRPDSRGLVFTLNGSTHPSKLWFWDLATGTAAPLIGEDSSLVLNARFVEPALIHYPSFDGRCIPAFLYRPQQPAPAQGYPTVVYVHGGPESQYRPQFKPEIQFMVQQGYAVLATNVRGSSGYGRTYMALDDVRLRMDSVKDLQHAGLWLAARADINHQRMAVMGGSYGGFMVLAAITHYPQLWAAAVEFYGIANFQTLLANTGPWRRRHRAAEYGDPVKDADFLHSISPIHQVDNITVPLFVAQGLRDPRVPPSESEQIVNRLKARGQAVEYMTFADEGHGFVKRANRIAVYQAVATFLDRHLSAQ